MGSKINNRKKYLKKITVCVRLGWSPEAEFSASAGQELLRLDPEDVENNRRIFIFEKSRCTSDVQ